MLAIRVLFRQGRLWEEHDPGAFSHTQNTHVVWTCIAAGLVMAIAGILHFANGGLIVGTVAVLCGVLYAVTQSLPLAFRRWPKRAILWTDLAWSAASLFALALPALILISAIAGEWVFFGYSLLMQVLFGTAIIREIEVRYLMFEGSEEGRSLLKLISQDRAGIGKWVQPQIDAYVRLPRALIRKASQPSAK